MENENTNVTTTETAPAANAADDYINAIQQLKSTTVDKSLYEQKVEENKKLISALMDGANNSSLIQNNNKEKSISSHDLRQKFYDDDVEMNNLEFISTALQLREALMAEGKPDPFLPSGHKVVATSEDESAAARVAEALQCCVDIAEGDNDVFTQELQRIMVDVPLPKKPKARR